VSRNREGRPWPLASAGLLLAVACAGGPRPTGHSEAVQGQVYAKPLDDVLAETQSLLVEQGWRVQRSGDQLATNWHLDGTGSAFGYLVDGERIDAGHCTVHIESLTAVSLGSPIEDREARSSNVSASVTAGSDKQEGVSTLTAPPGMVTLPRGRDEALEWALLQRVDPRAAKAIERLDARPERQPSADGGAAANATQAACPPPLSPAEAARLETRLVLLGDVPGTNEIPAFVAALACQAARGGVPVVVALELLRVDQPWVDTYFSSAGGAAVRAAFLASARSFGPAGLSGRGSGAVLALLDVLRGLRDGGLPLRVLAFDEAANAPSRNQARARTLEQARRSEPEALLLVVVERGAARTVRPAGEASEAASLGWYLARWGLRPLALDLRSPGGEAWACPSGGACGPTPVPGQAPPPDGPGQTLQFFPHPDAEGFAGTYVVGPLTASPPARP
jgi:hypothetical protein